MELKINYPIEFVKYQRDWQLRDAKRRTLINVNINGLDYVGAMQTELFLKQTAELWNRHNQIESPEIIIETLPELVKEEKKKPGRPKKK